MPLSTTSAGRAGGLELRLLAQPVERRRELGHLARRTGRVASRPRSAPTTRNRSGLARTRSSAWVPIDPVRTEDHDVAGTHPDILPVRRPGSGIHAPSRPGESGNRCRNPPPRTEPQVLGSTHDRTHRRDPHRRPRPPPGAPPRHRDPRARSPGPGWTARRPHVADGVGTMLPVFVEAAGGGVIRRRRRQLADRPRLRHRGRQRRQRRAAPWSRRSQEQVARSPTPAS